ncbi:MAG: RutC family protein [Candidatus Heimdallarchaeota archaeon LC_3]|nr:MAG: RutC family protein [Candidatus Heimdallarchaeota archaeon LC_3]
MDKKIIFTELAPKAIGPYSQAVISNGFLFISGQIAINPKNGEFDPDSDIESQTELVMRNLEAILKSQNISFDNVIKTTIFLADMNDFLTVNKIYGSFLLNEKIYPARATVALALPKGAKIEIDMIATIS